jgi:hypothetical protein
MTEAIDVDSATIVTILHLISPRVPDRGARTSRNAFHRKYGWRAALPGVDAAYAPPVEVQGCVLEKR